MPSSIERPFSGGSSSPNRANYSMSALGDLGSEGLPQGLIGPGEARPGRQHRWSQRVALPGAGCYRHHAVWTWMSPNPINL